jgi:hypothetical protein
MTAPYGESAARTGRLPSVVCAIVILAVLGVFCAMSRGSNVGRKVVLGREWPANERVSINAIDHRDWDRLLRRHVDEQGNVDYGAWHDCPRDIQALDDYLSGLSQANPRFDSTRDARLAFWINAYNALTIRGILREYPTPTIRNHTARLWGFNMWRDLLLHVGEADYSLGQIEHELLRPLHEPRIHFAIVCGSRGCPRLLNRAYQSFDLEQQLHENSQNFFADPQKLSYDAGTGQLRLSPILKWYAEDFGQSPAEMLKTIAPYLPDRIPRELPARGGLRTDFLDYDWGLNERPALDPEPPLPP